MKFLFIEPHLDDNVLMAGGTIARLLEERHEVKVLTLSHIYEGVDLVDEWHESMKVLGVVERQLLSFRTRMFSTEANDILQVLFSFEPMYDVFIIPSVDDYHTDHSTTARQAVRAFKNKTILSWQQPWNHRKLIKTFHVKLEHRHVQKKMQALGCYKSQINRSYFNQDVIVAQMHVDGMMCKSTYAESFQVVNMVV